MNEKAVLIIFACMASLYVIIVSLLHFVDDLYFCVQVPSNFDMNNIMFTKELI